MKNLDRFKLIGVTIISLYLGACDSRGLDAPLHNSYTNENFWDSKEEVEAGLNGCYEVLYNSGLYGFSISGGIVTETFTPNAFGIGASTPFVNGDLSPDNVTLLADRWEAAYKGIGRVNTVLDNYKAAGLSQRDEDEIEGQALFLRALFYENLVFYYGGVPLILKAPDLEKQGRLPRSSMDEVIQQMLTDLDAAAQKLPYSYNSNNIGRATKGAALALKARILLYYASPLFNPENDMDKWKAAAGAAKKVMDIAAEAGYGLFPDYRNLFMEDYENNKEVIFDVEYSAPRITSSCNVILELQQNITPLLGLVNSYYMIDGKSIQNSPLYDPDEPYKNRDPRLLQTIVVPGSMFMGKMANTTEYNSTGFVFKKNTDYKDSISYPGAPIRASGLNIILLRYADVLLMYAEAENEAEGPNSSVYDALNKIRDRSGMPPILPGLSKEQMRTEIRHERRIELAGEGLYYMDVRRWKIADEVMNGPVYNSDGKVLQIRKFTSKEYMWPLPTILLERNPALEQTPGY